MNCRRGTRCGERQAEVRGRPFRFAGMGSTGEPIEGDGLPYGREYMTWMNGLP